MNRNVLILNGGIPYQILKWEDSLENIFSNKSYIIEEYKDVPLRAGGGEEIMKCPSVVMLKEFIPFNPAPKYSRDNVFLRDSYSCQYCGVLIENPLEREIDHVIPKSNKACPGTNFENVVLVCNVCNRQKSNKSLKDMKIERCWNGKPFQLIRNPESPRERIGFAKFIMAINKHNLMWLKYIPNFEHYAIRLGKDWLIDAYKEYLEREKEDEKTQY